MRLQIERLPGDIFEVRVNGVCVDAYTKNKPYYIVTADGDIVSGLIKDVNDKEMCFVGSQGERLELQDMHSDYLSAMQSQQAAQERKLAQLKLTATKTESLITQLSTRIASLRRLCALPPETMLVTRKAASRNHDSRVLKVAEYTGREMIDSFILSLPNNADLLRNAIVIGATVEKVRAALPDATIYDLDQDQEAWNL